MYKRRRKGKSKKRVTKRVRVESEGLLKIRKRQRKAGVPKFAITVTNG